MLQLPRQRNGEGVTNFKKLEVVDVLGTRRGKYMNESLEQTVRRIYKIPSATGDGWDSSVGIATRYWLDGPGIDSRWGARFSAPVRTGTGANPASCTMGIGSFPGVKRPGLGADRPPPSSVPRS